MDGNIIAFIIWSVVGCMFIALSISSFFSKKPVGFWANADICEVSDIKKYNHAVAKLLCIYGVVFMILGTPLMSGQNSAWILFSVAGLMIESIIAMVIYTLVIEKKYKN